MEPVSSTTKPQFLEPITKTIEIESQAEKSERANQEEASLRAIVLGTSIEEEFQKIDQSLFPDPLPPIEDNREALTEAVVQTVLQSESDSYRIRFYKDIIEGGDETQIASIVDTMLKLDLMNQIDSEAIEKASGGDRSIYERVLDGLDWYILRGFTIGLYEDVVRDSESRGRETLEALSNMSVKEFEQYYRANVEERMKEGFFTSENLNGLELRAGQSRNAGIDPDASVSQLLGVFELVTLLPAFKILKARNLANATAMDHAAASTKLNSRAAQTATRGIPDPQSVTSVSPSSVTATSTNANAAPLTKILTTNKYVDDMSTALRRSVTGDELASVLTTRVANIQKSVGYSPVNEKTIETAFDNFVTEVSLGTTKGDLFVNKGLATVAANKVRKNVPDAEVFVRQVGDKHEVVIRQQVAQIASDDVSVPLTNAVYSTVFRAIGSSRFNDDKWIASVAAFNEGVLSKFTKSLEIEYNNSLKSLDKFEENTLSSVVERLWNGPDAGKKAWYTDTEFEAVYSSYHPAALPPSSSVVKAYNTLKDSSDAAAVFTALPKLKRAVDKGYVRLLSDHWTHLKGRVVQKVDADEPVIDLSKPVTGKSLLEGSRDGVTIYRLSEPVRYKNLTVKYGAKPKEVKLLTLDDVMGYNAGPRRQNPNARYFVTVGKKTPRALLSAFSKKQALQAEGQIKAIMANPTDEVIQANNSWNPSIQTVADWNQYKKDWGIKPGATISNKERDGLIADGDLDLFNNETWDEYFMSTSTRQNTVLPEFGGEPSFNMTPSQAIADQLSSTAFGVAFNGATLRSKKTFAEMVRNNPDKVRIPRGLSVDDYDVLFDRIEITGTDRVSEKMRAFRQAIRNRTHMKSGLDTFMERVGDQAKEWVFDTFGKKISGSRVGLQDGLLNFNFHSTMGLGNISQFFMQGFQASIIAAISPRQGFRGAVAGIPLGQLAHWIGKGNTAYADRVAKALSSTLGGSQEAYKQAAIYLRRSGRDILDGTAIEKGTAASFGFKQFGPRGFVQRTVQAGGEAVSKAADVGLIPFKKGEQFSRRTAIITSHLEAEDLMSQSGNILSGRKWDDDIVQSWITDREQALTLNMSNSGQAAFQRGLMKIPTQWLSFTLRVFENLMTGRQFTKAERARMALWIGPMMGLNYMGGDIALGHLAEAFGKEGTQTATDLIAEGLDIDPKSSLYTGLQFGLIDGLLDYAGFDLSVSSRVSYPAGLMDLMDKVNDKPIELAGGPTSSITLGTIEAAYDAIRHAANGRETLFTSDVIKTLRSIKGVDNALLAAGILSHGQMRTRNSVKYNEWEMDTADAVAFALGFRTHEYNRILEASNFVYHSEERIRERRKYYSTKYNTAHDLMRSNDSEEFNRGIRMFQEITDELNLEAKLPRSVKDSIFSGVLDPQKSRAHDTIEHLLKLERDLLAESLLQE